MKQSQTRETNLNDKSVRKLFLKLSLLIIKLLNTTIEKFDLEQDPMNTANTKWHTTQEEKKKPKYRRTKWHTGGRKTVRKARCAVRKYPPKEECLALLQHKNMPRTEREWGCSARLLIR